MVNCSRQTRLQKVHTILYVTFLRGALLAHKDTQHAVWVMRGETMVHGCTIIVATKLVTVTVWACLQCAVKPRALVRLAIVCSEAHSVRQISHAAN